jgi:hypothetical protein
MFNIIGSKSIFNKAEIKKVIIESDNVTIDFQEGYADGDAFAAVGSDHICLKDVIADAEADPPVEALAEFSNFMAGYSAAEDKTAYAEAIVAQKK